MYFEIHDIAIEEHARAPAMRRLLAEWTSLNEKFGYVPFEPFDPLSLGPLAESIIVKVPIDENDYVYAHFGRNIADRVGTDMTGRRTSEFQGEVGDFFREASARAVAECRPLLTLHRGSASIQVHLWERLILPCRDTDGSPIIVVYCSTREFRDDLLSAILDASLDAIVAVRLVRDPDGHPVDGELIAANKRAAQLVDRPINDMLAARLLSLYPHLVPSGLWDRYLGVAKSRDAIEFVTPYPYREGGERWFEVAVAPLGDGFMVTYADITGKKLAEDAARLTQLEHAAANEALKSEIARRQELEEELSRLATRDPLTGALNRRALTDGLQRALSLAERYGHPVSVFAADLDHFKRINDLYGHAGGDAVLKATVDLMTHGLREDVDLFGRLGGEEFIAILPHTGLTAAAAVAERMRGLLAAMDVPFENEIIRCSGSFGVAAWDGRETLDRLMSRADAALYKSKASGRNVVAVDEGAGEILVVRMPGAESIVPSSTVMPFAPKTRQNSAPRRKSPTGHS